MDELGSRVSHCDTPQEEDGSDVEEDDEVARPNTRCVPFFYNARGISYSLLWPVTDIEPGALELVPARTGSSPFSPKFPSGDIITRDFLEGVKGSLQRAARGREEIWSLVEPLLTLLFLAAPELRCRRGIWH